MKELCVKNGTVYLDGEKVDHLKRYKIVSSETESGVAELTITIDVSTVATCSGSKQQ